MRCYCEGLTASMGGYLLAACGACICLSTQNEIICDERDLGTGLCLSLGLMSFGNL